MVDIVSRTLKVLLAYDLPKNPQPQPQVQLWSDMQLGLSIMLIGLYLFFEPQTGIWYLFGLA
jgi:hypothetical protein